MTSTAQVKAFFEQVSGDWDDMRSSFYNEAVIDALADNAEVGAETTVIDVGSGTGYIAAGLASRARSVVAVDNATAMLAVAARNFAVLGATNVVIHEAELDALPFEDGNFDAAVANMVLHHAPDPAAMIAEMTRVVRPGGLVVITDEIEHSYEWMRTEQADIWLGFPETDIESFFNRARLVEYGYASLGQQ